MRHETFRVDENNAEIHLRPHYTCSTDRKLVLGRGLEIFITLPESLYLQPEQLCGIGLRSDDVSTLTHNLSLALRVTRV